MTRRWKPLRAWGMAVVVGLAATACAASPGSSASSATSSGGGTSASRSSSTSSSAEGSRSSSAQATGGTTAIVLRIGDRTINATLYANPAARDFAAMLPFTTQFRDYGGQEKTGTPPRPVSSDGEPAGADPERDEIGFYTPNGVVVLWYSDIGYFTGIIRLGRFDASGREAIRSLADGTDVTFERA